MNGLDVCFCADVHVGNPRAFGGPMVSGVNARGRHVLAALRAAVDDAVADGSDALVVLGDLFDSSRATPQLVAAVMEVLLAAAENGVPVHLLLGNHDQESTDAGDNALAPLAQMEGVTVHEEPRVIALRKSVELWMVPFQVGRASAWLPGALESLAAGGKPGTTIALALHLGVIDGATLPYLRESPDAIDLGLLRELCARYGIGHVFCGNWHDRRVWEGAGVAKVVQVGALAPTGFNNPGFDGYGMVEHWRGDASDGRVVAEGPRFATVRSRAEWDAIIRRVKGLPEPSGPVTWDDVASPDSAPPPDPLEPRSGALPPTFVRWVVAGGRDAHAEAAALAREETELGALAGAEVLPDVHAVEEAAHAAAAAARAVPTLRQAVVEYVGALGLPTDRAEAVRALSLGYLRAGESHA